MEFFEKAKSVRLKSNHDKFLHADPDQECVYQDRSGSTKTVKWTVEFPEELNNVIRLKSIYGKYLTALDDQRLFGVTGQKVVQSLPSKLDSSVEWEPIKEGSAVKLKTRYGNFLRANSGLPPWRNSVTHDIPHRHQDWILWTVDTVEVLPESPDETVSQSESVADDDFTSSFRLTSAKFSYLLSNERGHDIISQNKEGIFSIFGYWGLYLVCVQLGNYLFFGKPGDAVLRTNDWARIRVWIICLLLWLLTILLDRHVERVSRRMCNLAYVTVVLAMNLQVFAVLTLADYVPGYKVAALIEYFDRNLLGSFLLANVLTGMVNLSMDTLSVSPFGALAILFGYAYILSIAAAVAHYYGIRLKFW